MSISRDVGERSEAILRIENALNGLSYKEAIENSSLYNNQLVLDRKSRLPFIDSQTGVAQSDCCLWMQKWERMPGSQKGQVYTYPAKRWIRRKRGYLNADYSKKTNESNENELNGQTDNSIKLENEPMSGENSHDKWYQELDDDDIPDAGELDDPESEDDDYEEYTSRRRRTKKTEGRRKKREIPESEKPYSCDICKMRYKTKTGLSYHYQNIHHQEQDTRNITASNGCSKGSEEESYNPPRPVKLNNLNISSPAYTPRSFVPLTNSTSGYPQMNKFHPSNPNIVPSNNNLANLNMMVNNAARANTTPLHQRFNTDPSNKSNESSDSQKVEDSNETTSKEKKKPVTANPYCDFCLGDSDENKKTKSAEILVSCSDCGRSGHPTCLQFTENMIKSVKKYRWQCIECKSCGICGTSDNDEQLLFCDDCDRGYHMYCLNPPLSEPPEGSWSCRLCIIEYHTPKTKS